MELRPLALCYLQIHLANTIFTYICAFFQVIMCEWLWNVFWKGKPPTLKAGFLHSSKTEVTK